MLLSQSKIQQDSEEQAPGSSLRLEIILQNYTIQTNTALHLQSSAQKLCAVYAVLMSDKRKTFTYCWFCWVSAWACLSLTLRCPGHLLTSLAPCLYAFWISSSCGGWWWAAAVDSLGHSAAPLWFLAFCPLKQFVYYKKNHFDHCGCLEVHLPVEIQSLKVSWG